MFTAEEGLQKLKEGNKKYLAEKGMGDISRARREATLKNGQAPYAIIITCADARVIPEAIFATGLGDLFVIRVAGNVLDDHQLGSIEYAATHLGASLVVVLGHTHCGAVDAAIKHNPEGYIRFITDEIKAAIGDEKDPLAACRLNVKRSVKIIEESFTIKNAGTRGLKVLGAVYYLEDGHVEFL